MTERGGTEQRPDGNTPPELPLQTASAGRSDWSNTTPIDDGESLFGPFDSDERARSPVGPGFDCPLRHRRDRLSLADG
jgi:hypothetical protein